MASRRLKFKPKPLVGSSVRRPREKDDSTDPSESISTEQTSQFLEKSSISSDVLTESAEFVGETKSEPTAKELTAAAQLLNLSSINFTANLDDKNIACNEPCASNNSIKSSNYLHSKKSSTDYNIESLTNNIKNKDSTPIQPMNDADSIQASVESKTETVSEQLENQVLVPIKSMNNSEPDPNLYGNKTIITSENVPNKSLNETDCPPVEISETSEKTNTLKNVPKFGRSRCKPVLSNLAKRKKISTDDNERMNSDVTSVRTESVIKSVEAEISKVNSTVLEIKESFTSLEAEEEPEIVANVKNNISKANSTVLEMTESFSSLEAEEKRKTVSEIVERETPPKDFDDTKFENRTNNKITSTKSSKCSGTEKRTQSVIVDIYPLTKNVSETNIENKDKSSISGKVPMSPIRGTAKLVPKPSPRLSDVKTRRLSFQGSDSEEELKRKKPHLMNEKDSKTDKITLDNTFKSNKRKQRAQGSTYSKMGQDTLEKFSKKFGSSGVPDKSQLKMIDLIFYNPKSNPMTSKPQTKALLKKKEDNPNDMGEEDGLAEQEVDDVEEAPALPVPQLKIGPDGQIMLDPQSLVIETTGTEKSRAELEKSEVVQETGLTRYNTYSKKRHTRKDWTPQETLQFYKALNTIGTDFSLMCQLFPKRSRHELKLKFKKEEKTNLQLIDKAIKGPIEFNFEALQEDLREEREEMARKKLEKHLAEEATKREKALKKEEKQKLKEIKKKKKRTPIDRTKKLRYAAIKDFDEAERGELPLTRGTCKALQKKKKIPKKKVGIVKTESVLSDTIQVEDSEDEGLQVMRMVKQVSSGRIIKPTTKLEEYEEMNETLRKKLEQDYDSPEENDSYSFLPGAQMLFGEPVRADTSEPPDQEPNNDFTIEIQALPSIEQSLLMKSNVEEVSEISELGSFGQDDNVLDLSAPVRANITKDMLLNRHLISESIQIIDQLTENQETSEVVLGSVNAMDDVHNILPSFESVARPPVIYPSQTSHSETLSSQMDVNNDSNHNVDDATQYNPSEECILGE